MRKWVGAVIAALLIAALATVGFIMLRGVTDVVRGADFGGGEPDPMFSQPPESVTRPPELDAEEPQPTHPTLDDYVPENESPVDQTAAELIEEARLAAQN